MTELVQRVAIALFELDRGVKPLTNAWLDYEPAARVAIAEVFDWLERPRPRKNETRGEALANMLNEAQFRTVLAQMRKEALGE